MRVDGFLFGGGEGEETVFWQFFGLQYIQREIWGVWRGTFDTFDTGGLPMACPGGEVVPTLDLLVGWLGCVELGSSE